MDSGRADIDNRADAKRRERRAACRTQPREVAASEEPPARDPATAHQGQPANVPGVGRLGDEFVKLLSDHGVPLVDLSEEELEREMNALQRILPKEEKG